MDRLTNISFNTKASVETEIRRQERIHPFWGLRQAEEFIRDRTAALRETLYKARAGARELSQLRQQLQSTTDLDDGCLTLADQNAQEDCHDRIAKIEEEQAMIAPMIRDCKMELDTAITEKQRILATHPALNQDYETLQCEMSKSALTAKEATFIAGRVLAARQGLPESVAEILVLSLPEERDQLMRRVTELLDAPQVQLTMYQLSLHLSEYSDSDRALFLEQSAALVQQHRQRQLESQHGLEKD